MMLKIYSVVGLLTNLRWHWLKFYLFFLFYREGEGVRSKVIFMTRGEGR